MIGSSVCRAAVVSYETYSVNSILDVHFLYRPRSTQLAGLRIVDRQKGLVLFVDMYIKEFLDLMTESLDTHQRWKRVSSSFIPFKFSQQTFYSIWIANCSIGIKFNAGGDVLLLSLSVVRQILKLIRESLFWQEAYGHCQDDDDNNKSPSI